MDESELCMDIFLREPDKYINIETKRPITKLDNYKYKNDIYKIVSNNQELFDHVIMGLFYLEKTQYFFGDDDKYLNVSTGRIIKKPDNYKYQNKNLQIVGTEEEPFNTLVKIFGNFSQLFGKSKEKSTNASSSKTQQFDLNDKNGDGSMMDVTPKKKQVNANGEDENNKNKPIISLSSYKTQQVDVNDKNKGKSSTNITSPKKKQPNVNDEDEDEDEDEDIKENINKNKGKFFTNITPKKKQPNINDEDEDEDEYEDTKENKNKNKQEQTSENIKGRLRKTIPKPIKDATWNAYANSGKNGRIGRCFMCLCDIDMQSPWHCSHVVSVANGGSDTPYNLRPLCPNCNLSMGKQNMLDFAKQFHPDRANLFE